MLEFDIQRSPRGNPAALNTPVPKYGFDIWTPSLTFGGANTGLAGAAFSTYQRIGDRCYIDTDITLTAKGSSTGVAEIYLLPFGSWGNTPPFVGHWLNMTSSLVTMAGILGAGSLGATAILIYGLTAGATSMAQLTHADFSNTSTVRFSGFYTINDA